MSSEENTVEVILNPLTFMELEESWVFGRDGKPPTAEEVLTFLCPLGERSPRDRIVERYQELMGQEGKRLSIAPAEQQILHKLILPLRQAIGCYMAANYLGTVALCGMVCEMLAVFWYELAQVRAQNKVMDEKTQKRMYGRTFERLGQERRVEVMLATGLIDEEIAALFDRVRLLRRRYLHFLSQEHKELSGDAADTWRATRDLMLRVLNVDFDDGKLRLDPTLLRYLKDSAAEQ